MHLERDIKFITSEQNTVIFPSHCETMLTDSHPCTAEVHAVWGTRLSLSVSQIYTVESGRSFYLELVAPMGCSIHGVNVFME